MADNQLDEGFEEVSLDEGFEEQPLDAAPVAAAPVAPASSEQSLPDVNPIKYDPTSYLMAGGLTLGKKLASTVMPIEDTSYEGTLKDVQNLKRGMLEGGTMGAIDEIAGAVKAPIAKLAGEEGSLGELYRKYQKIEEGKYKTAKEESPKSTTLGMLGGAVAGGLATGGLGLEANIAKGLGSVGVKEALKQGGKLAAVKEIGKLGLAAGAEGAAQGAIQGGFQSEGTLDSVEGTKDILSDIKSGATFGFGAGAGLKAAGGVGQLKGAVDESAAKETSKFMMENPRLRQVAKIYERAKEGLPSTGTDYAGEKINVVRELTDKFTKASDIVGKKLEDAYLAADAQGIKVPLDKSLEESASALQSYAKTNPYLTEVMEANPQYKKTLMSIFNIKNTQLSPSQARTLQNDIFTMADKLKDPQLKAIAADFGSSLKKSTDMATPQIKSISDQFYKLNKFGSETIGLGGADPTAIQGFKSIDKAKLSEDIKDMLNIATTPGVSKDKANYIFSHLKENLSKVEQDHPGTLKTLGFDNLDDIEKTFKVKSDLFAMENVLEGGSGVGEVMSNNPLKAIAQGASSPVLTKAAYKGADIAGRIASKVNPNLKLNETLKNADSNELIGLATSMVNSDNKKVVATGKYLLNALQNKSSGSRNAAIFMINSDPNLREAVRDMVGMGEKDDEQQ